MKSFKTVALMLALLLILPLVAACSSTPTYMKVGSYDVSYDMMRYVVMSYKTGYADIEPAEFLIDPELQAALAENTNSTIREMMAYKYIAKKLDISLTADEKKAIKAKIEEVKAGYDSEEQYKNGLESNYITEEVMEEIYTVQALCDKIYDHLVDGNYFKTDNSTIMGDINAGNFFAAEYVSINCTGADTEKCKALLGQIKALVDSGEEMSIAYADIYPSSGFNNKDFAYCKLDAFTYHDEYQFFEDAVVALEVGQVSEVIHDSGMVVLIKRIAIDDEYVDKNFNDIIARYLSREFFEYVRDNANELEINIEKKYKDTEYWEIK